jgi:hypothetical protein
MSRLRVALIVWPCHASTTYRFSGQLFEAIRSTGLIVQASSRQLQWIVA